MKEINEDSILQNGSTFFERLLDRKMDKQKPASFKKVFGDLSKCVFSGSVELSGLNISSLEGCPYEIKNGFFDISRNKELKTLDYFPKKLSSGHILYIDYELASNLKYLPVEIYKDLELKISNLEDFELLHNKNFEIDFIDSFLKFRKINGSFSKIGTITNSVQEVFPRLERLYLVYEKLNFDKEKFRRARNLLII